MVSANVWDFLGCGQTAGSIVVPVMLSAELGGIPHKASANRQNCLGCDQISGGKVALVMVSEEVGGVVAWLTVHAYRQN